MSHLTLKKFAILGALSLAGMAQTATAQWMPFGGGGGCGCQVPAIPASICGPTCCAPPQPQFVMQPVTEMKTCERIVQRPVVETRMIPVTQTEYRQVMEPRTAQVQSCTYRNVTEMQTRQRDCGRYVTNYRCRPYVAPCAYDNRPGLFGMMNRALYQARMAVTPAVIAERTYVPNIITEQIPVTRQVAVPTTQTITYNVPRTVAYTTRREVAVQEVRMVAERLRENVPVTTMRMVPYGNSAMAYGINPGLGTAAVPGLIPDRTAMREPVVTPATPIPGKTGPRGAVAPNAPVPHVPDPPPGASRTRAPRSLTADEVVEEVAQTAAPVRHTAAYRPIASPITTSSSLPSIVRISQRRIQPTIAERDSDVTVASSKKTTRK